MAEPVTAGGRSAGSGDRQPRVILNMTPELIARIDEELHRRKLQSRAETIRALLEEALSK